MQMVSRVTLMLVLGVGLASIGGIAQADEPQLGCAGKKQAIEREINYARENGNTRRVQGLQKALAEAQNCNDAQLQRESENDVAKAQAKVQERERELAEEKAEGKSKDIAKAQKKLDLANKELETAKAEVYR
jgi:hypothetical protein